MLTDLGTADRPLVTVPPQRLVLGLVLSSEWIISTAFLVTGGALALAFNVVRTPCPR